MKNEEGTCSRTFAQTHRTFFTLLFNPLFYPSLCKRERDKKKRKKLKQEWSQIHLLFAQFSTFSLPFSRLNFFYYCTLYPLLSYMHISPSRILLVGKFSRNEKRKHNLWPGNKTKSLLHTTFIFKPRENGLNIYLFLFIYSNCTSSHSSSFCTSSYSIFNLLHGPHSRSLLRNEIVMHKGHPDRHHLSHSRSW